MNLSDFKPAKRGDGLNLQDLSAEEKKVFRALFDRINKRILECSEAEYHFRVQVNEQERLLERYVAAVFTEWTVGYRFEEAEDFGPMSCDGQRYFVFEFKGN
jgi:hypothetical protein